ncbi:hypothetical protein [Nitrosospira sp. Nsp2]|uniref:hypothetical protein n=1 Tax=Nitrosospira sp. Nsp2 TaxID=136548 RepID=UPI0011B25567|nr:hypothetical protein [Nitrosospira sp. Nsp2]
MDVLYFLGERTTYIRWFYETACLPFRENIGKIAAGISPFVTPYCEDGDEPPFMKEWQEANAALEILGGNCLSMLSESLKLYFKAWETHFWTKPRCQRCFKEPFRSGFLAGYRACFEKTLEVDWSNCPADFTVLEQVILARNSVQHPKNIMTLAPSHDADILEKYREPFFMSDTDKELITPQSSGILWLSRSLHVSREKLFIAIDQVELFANWLDERILDARYPERKRMIE